MPLSRSSSPRCAAGRSPELHAALVKHELVVLRAVARHEEEEDALVADHARGDGLQRGADARHDGHRLRGEGGATVDERHGAAGGAEALGEGCAREVDLAAEDFLRAVAADGEEVHVNAPRRAGLQRGERLVEQRLLLVERRL